MWKVSGSCCSSDVDRVIWHPHSSPKDSEMSPTYGELGNWSFWVKAWLDEILRISDVITKDRAVSPTTNRKTTSNTRVLESFVQIGTSWRKSRNIFRLSASWKWPRIKPSYHRWYTCNTGDYRSITFYNEELTQKTHLKCFSDHLRGFLRSPPRWTWNKIYGASHGWTTTLTTPMNPFNLHMYNHGKVGFRSTSNQNI